MDSKKVVSIKKNVKSKKVFDSNIDHNEICTRVHKLIMKLGAKFSNPEEACGYFYAVYANALLYMGYKAEDIHATVDQGLLMGGVAKKSENKKDSLLLYP